MALYAGRPDSVTLATSGNPGKRLGPVTATGRGVAAGSCASSPMVPASTRSISPRSARTIAGPAPWNGACPERAPPSERKSSPAKCGPATVPEEPKKVAGARLGECDRLHDVSLRRQGMVRRHELHGGESREGPEVRQRVAARLRADARMGRKIVRRCEKRLAIGSGPRGPLRHAGRCRAVLDYEREAELLAEAVPERAHRGIDAGARRIRQDDPEKARRPRLRGRRVGDEPRGREHKSEGEGARHVFFLSASDRFSSIERRAPGPFSDRSSHSRASPAARTGRGSGPRRAGLFRGRGALRSSDPSR